MTDDPGAGIPVFDEAGGARTVSLDSLRLLGEAVNALRVGADALAGANSRFAGAAAGVGQEMGDTRIGAAHDAAVRTTRQSLRSLGDCWERLARGLDSVADAYTTSGPPVTGPEVP